MKKDDVDSCGVMSANQHALGDESADRDVMSMLPEERLALVWPLTVQAWTFASGFDPEGRLQKHIVRSFDRKRSANE